MRSIVIAAVALTAFVAMTVINTTDANAVYCKTVGVPKGCVARPMAHPHVVYCKRVGYPKGCVAR